MGILIPADIVQSTGLSEKELLLEIAISMYQRQVISLGKAAKLAGIHRFAFQKELAKREIPLNISIEDIENDLKTLKGLDV